MVDKSGCTGCSACAAACPVEAIAMKPDADGFLYPQVDGGRCIHCDKCHRVCPADRPRQEQAPERAYFAMAKDSKLRQNSSSGGAFTLLAEQVLAQGGLVFGCAMTDDCTGAHHVAVATAAELNPLRGSKYVQSDLGDALRQAKKALAENRLVLFTGTPCQIGGVKAYLGQRDKLLTVDVICHGVPSPMVWRTYLAELEREYGAKAQSVRFRDKTEGWQRYSLVVTFDNGQIYRKNVLEDLYLRGFVENLYLRPSCHDCRFKGDGYASDMTVADFWGISEIRPELGDCNGVSLVIPHTASGEQMAAWLAAEPVPVNQALRHNRSYYQPAPASPFREKALKQIRRCGTGKTLHKYCGFGFEAKLRKKLKF